MAPVKILSSKLIYDADLKPRFRIELINNSKVSVIGFLLNIELTNSVSRLSNCKFYLKRKQEILSRKKLIITGRIPEFDQICNYDIVTAEIQEFFFSDGTKVNALELLLKSQ